MTWFTPQLVKESGPPALQTTDLGKKKRDVEHNLDWITGTNHLRNQEVLRAND